MHSLKDHPVNIPDSICFRRAAKSPIMTDNMAQRKMSEYEEWKAIRPLLVERAGVTENELRDLAETEADALDMVELVMALKKNIN